MVDRAFPSSLPRAVFRVLRRDRAEGVVRGGFGRKLTEFLPLRRIDAFGNETARVVAFRPRGCFSFGFAFVIENKERSMWVQSLYVKEQYPQLYPHVPTKSRFAMWRSARKNSHKILKTNQKTKL